MVQINFPFQTHRFPVKVGLSNHIEGQLIYYTFSRNTISNIRSGFPGRGPWRCGNLVKTMLIICGGATLGKSNWKKIAHSETGKKSHMSIVIHHKKSVINLVLFINEKISHVSCYQSYEKLHRSRAVLNLVHNFACWKSICFQLLWNYCRFPNCNRTKERGSTSALQGVCCSVLQCVAVCCNVLPCVTACCNLIKCVAVCCTHLYVDD